MLGKIAKTGQAGRTAAEGLCLHTVLSKGLSAVGTLRQRLKDRTNKLCGHLGRNTPGRGDNTGQGPLMGVCRPHGTNGCFIINLITVMIII